MVLLQAHTVVGRIQIIEALVVGLKVNLLMTQLGTTSFPRGCMQPCHVAITIGSSQGCWLLQGQQDALSHQSAKMESKS